jgi:hypothetical protein
MKLTLLIIIFCIYLFYLFKKNKFKGGDIYQSKINEFNTEFNNEYKKSLKSIKIIRTNYNKITPTNQVYSKLFKEPLNSVMSNINNLDNYYNKLQNYYNKLLKIFKNNKCDRDTIDLTQCSHSIITTFIYTPNLKLYLHSNSTQHGNLYDGFSYGSKSEDISWTIEFCGIEFDNNTVVHIKSSYYNKYWMSNSNKGEGFKWNDVRLPSKAWHLINIDENKYKLQSIYLKNMNIKENCLSNNIAEGSKFSWSYEKEENRYIEWSLETINIHK